MEIPIEIIINVIIPLCKYEFMGVSKRTREVTRKNLLTNPHLNKAVLQKGLESAAKYGDLELIMIILQSFITDEHDYHNAIRSATKYGQLDLLLKLIEYYPGDDMEPKLISMPAVLHCQYNIMEHLIKEEIISVQEFLSESNECCQKACFDYIVDNILDKYEYDTVDILPRIIELNNEGWLDKCLQIKNLNISAAVIEHRCGQYASPINVKKILMHPRAQITNRLVSWVFMNDTISFDEFKILVDRAPDLGKEQDLIQDAIYTKNIDIFRYFLDRPGASVDYLYNTLGTAMGLNSDAIFDLILERGKLNQELLKKEIEDAVGRFCDKGPQLKKMLDRLKGVKVEPYIVKSMDVLAYYTEKGSGEANESQTLDLLKYPGVDPTYQTQLFFRRACENGWLNIINYLLEQPKVIPNAMENMSIRAAAMKGHVDVVKLLLAHPKVNPAASNNNAIQCAVMTNHIEVVKLLMADPRVNPAADNNSAYKKAKTQEMKDLLLQDERVKASLAKK